MFGRLVRGLSGSPALGILAIAVTPVLFQFRFYSDPILSFSALPQVIVMLIIGSLLALMAFMRSGRRRYLALSLVLYAISLLTYEITLPFFLLHAVIAWLYPSRHKAAKAWKLSWPFAGLAVLSSLAAVVTRIALKMPVAGGAAGTPYTPNADPFTAIATVARQVSAALPLSYHVALGATGGIDGVQPFEGPIAYLSRYPATSVAVLLGLGVTVFAALWLTREEEQKPRGRTALLLTFGAALAVLPAVLVALSPKYQGEILWGKGYIPVYVSYFGVALLLLTGIWWAVAAMRRARPAPVPAHKGPAKATARPAGKAKVTAKPPAATSAPRWAWIAMAGALAALVAVTGIVAYQDNRIIVERFSRDWLYPRQVEQSALSHGLMDKVPAGSTVLMRVLRAWDVSDFFVINAHKAVDPYDTRQMPSWAPLEASHTPSPAPGGGSKYTLSRSDAVYFADAEGLSQDNGFAIAGHLVSFTVTGGTVVSMTVDSMRIFVTTPQPYIAAPVLVGGIPYDPPRFTGPDVLGLDSAKLRRVSGGADWSLWELPEGQTLEMKP
jgi:hypothetical protein